MLFLADSPSWLSSFVNRMLNGLSVLIADWFNWLFSALLVLASKFISACLNLLPGFSADPDTVLEYLEISNHWFPVAESIAITGALFTWWILYVFTRWTLKAIPTIW